MNIRLVLQRSRKPPIAPGQIGADAVATNPHAQAAAEAIAKALERDPSARQRIEELMNPKSPDNDLAVFNGPTNPVQAALAPPAKPGPPPAAPLPGKKWS